MPKLVVLPFKGGSHFIHPRTFRASLIAQSVKNLPAVQGTRVQFLGWEDPLEKEMAIRSSTIAWETPWTEEPGRLQSKCLQRIGRG